MRGVVVPAVAALATGGAVAAAAFGVVSTLPQPTHDDRTGVRVLRVLETRHGGGSRISVGDRSLVAECRRLSARRRLVSLSDGSAFVVAGTRVYPSTAPNPAARSELAGSTAGEPPLLRAAEADLAGSYALYAAELAVQLEHGAPVLGAKRFVEGRPAYQIWLDDHRPRAALFVDSRTFEPLAAEFDSAQLKGRATLTPPDPLDPSVAC